MKEICARLLLTVGMPFAAALLGAVPARADGTVTRASGCGERIFAASLNGYSVLVASASGEVADGDLLTGDVERIGHVTLFDRNSGRTISALVEERGLNKSELAQRVAVYCRSLVANTLVSGRVERTEGCGNKIFVDTPKGYAVLERLAGGIVNDGDSLTGNFNKPGRATVLIRENGATMTVFVDEFELSRSALQRQINRHCRR